MEKKENKNDVKCESPISSNDNLVQKYRMIYSITMTESTQRDEFRDVEDDDAGSGFARNSIGTPRVRQMP